jgi:hypothetical protein
MKPRKSTLRSRCGAKTNRGRPCRTWPMPNGKCYRHGGASTGPRSESGRRAISEASTRDWKRWRQDRQLPEDWRYDDSRRRGGRQTAAQWVAENRPEGERS